MAESARATQRFVLKIDFVTEMNAIRERQPAFGRNISCLKASDACVTSCRPAIRPACGGKRIGSKIGAYYERVLKRSELMTIQQEVNDYLSECGVFYFATVDGDAPVVRPLGFHMEHDGQLYFGVGTFKSVYAQLNANPNVYVCACKPDGSGWVTGIKDPQNPSEGFSAKVLLSDISCVTSGSYERFYTVDGKPYHHIIDKDTLMPSTLFSSVTIITSDSGIADALSTALFAMSYEEGLTIVEKIGGVEVVWITPEGEIYTTSGIAALEAKG
jgi:hypothetical protein